MGVKFDDDIEENTIGGYAFNLIGKLPVVGDKVSDKNCTYEVLAMDKTAISKLKITKISNL